MSDDGSTGSGSVDIEAASMVSGDEEVNRGEENESWEDDDEEEVDEINHGKLTSVVIHTHSPGRRAHTSDVWTHLRRIHKHDVPGHEMNADCTHVCVFPLADGEDGVKRFCNQPLKLFRSSKATGATWSTSDSVAHSKKKHADSAYRAYEKGAEKWRKEHMPRRGKDNISAEGQELLEDKELWGNETALRGVIHDSRKRARSNVDGVFMPHQRGPITSTFTADWFLREGQGRELLGEWMKKTAVKSQDQRRMSYGYRRTLTRSRRTRGSIRSRKVENPIDATYSGLSGCRKVGSRRRRSSRNKRWVIFNTPVKPCPKLTLILIISAGG
jgi:hypothetical protein